MVTEAEIVACVPLCAQACTAGTRRLRLERGSLSLSAKTAIVKKSAQCTSIDTKAHDPLKKKKKEQNV